MAGGLRAATAGLLEESRRVVDRDGLDSLILFVNSTCNLRCGFCCYAEHLNQAKDIPLEQLLTVSRTLPPFRALLVSGGEPFLRRDLAEVMGAFVVGNGVEAVSVPTNGWYGERTVATCEAFLDRHDALLNVSLSVDGFAPLHDRVRGRARTFARLCETIRLLEPVRAAHPNLRLRLNSVVTPENIDEIRALVDWFHATFPVLDEHALELVRDLTREDADHESPARRAMADRFVELVEHSCLRYAGRDARRGQVPGVGDPVGNVLGSAHALASAGVKRDRVHGRLWGFPCTAGRKILVIDGEGSLKACEHRGEVVDLRSHDFDVGAALATGAMQREVDDIARDRCDCIHGCFVGNSLKHSPRGVVTREVPASVRFLRRARPAG